MAEHRTTTNGSTDPLTTSGGPDPADGMDDNAIIDILSRQVRTIAVVGASARSGRPSHQVCRFLIEQGYDVHPVNPGLAGGELLGRRVFATIADATAATSIDMVDVFRRSDAVPAIVEEAAAAGVRIVWLQLGVSHPAAEAAARAAGLTVIVNRCPRIEFQRLGSAIDRARAFPGNVTRP